MVNNDAPERTRGIPGIYSTVQNVRKLPYVRGAGRISGGDRAMLSKFFDKAPFFSQTWDLYHFEDTDNAKDVWLLSMAQIDKFLAMIRDETGVVIKRPAQYNFPPEAYTDELELLGTTTSEQEYEDLIATVAPPDYENTKGTVKSMTTKAHKQYKAEKKRLNSLVHGLQQVVLCRRWLGFADAQDPNEVKLRSLFVCVDVESHELNHRSILEVGVTSLDTKEIWGASGDEEPPHSFDELWKKVKVRHFRLKENRFLKNGRFVSDCSDKFGFGQSEWLGLEEAPAVIAQLFRFEDGEAGRVVFVGHDAGTDKAYLKQLGYNPDNVNGLQTVDTAKMWKAIKQEVNPKGLGALCNELDIIAWHLHNAGNDAAYTFQCLLKMALDYCPNIQATPAATPALTPTAAPETQNQGLVDGGGSLSSQPRVHPALPRGPLPEKIHHQHKGDGYGWDDSEELKKQVELVCAFLPYCIKALEAGFSRETTTNTEALVLWTFYEKFADRFGLTTEDFWWQAYENIAYSKAKDPDPTPEAEVLDGTCNVTGAAPETMALDSTPNVFGDSAVMDATNVTGAGSETVALDSAPDVIGDPVLMDATKGASFEYEVTVVDASIA